MSEASKADLKSFLMDFTFNTNVEGLLLGVAGPVGLWTGEQLPHMRLREILKNIEEG